MNWKKHYHKQNARHYAWPDGWDPAEVIAEQLECSPERVREHLAPSIRAGDVEVKSFTIWDGERKVLKTGFRIASAQEPKKKSTVNTSKPFAGAKVTRTRSPNKEIGVIVSLGKAGMKIEWPSTGPKIHSATAIRRGDLKIVE